MNIKLQGQWSLRLIFLHLILVSELAFVGTYTLLAIIASLHWCHNQTDERFWVGGSLTVAIFAGIWVTRLIIQTSMGWGVFWAVLLAVPLGFLIFMLLVMRSINC